MNCDFCKRDKNEIKEVFSIIFRGIDKEISLLQEKIINNKEGFSVEYGFTKDNFDKADKINVLILNMKIRTVLGDIDNFLQLDENIEILSNYLKRFNPEISHEKSMRDLLIKFKTEPTKERLKEVEAKYIKEKDKLIKHNNEIKCKIDGFSEIDVEFDIPLNIFDFHDNTIIYILERLKKTLETNEKRDIQKKMMLCPYCKYLFKDLKEKISNARDKTNRVPQNVIDGSSNSIRNFPRWDENE